PVQPQSFVKTEGDVEVPHLPDPRGFAPRPPRHAHSRGPHAPLRSRGSLAVLAHCSPSPSSKPKATLKFCTAWPAAPFTRLSMQATSTSWFVAALTRQPMSQKFVCATCLISGSSRPVRRTNGDSS